MNPITADDHILGNPNAPIMIVEYSDFDCPFCKAFHEVMQQIINEHGVTGEVAWVYRHYSINGSHPNATTLAVASECVADLGGNDAWKFIDLIFGERETNAQTDLTQLPDFAGNSGLMSCLSSL
ncbi:MAG: thioredoxin domain-containing protein [Candidatus Paceibacterota bacterium]